MAAPQRPSMLAAAVARGELTFDPPPGRRRRSLPFCAMGVCFECETVVDGRVVRLCLEPDGDRG